MIFIVCHLVAGATIGVYTPLNIQITSMPSEIYSWDLFLQARRQKVGEKPLLSFSTFMQVHFY